MIDNRIGMIVGLCHVSGNGNSTYVIKMNNGVVQHLTKKEMKILFTTVEGNTIVFV